MPNWCHNSITVSHKDPEMMEKFRCGVEHGTLFATLIPMPAALQDTTAPSMHKNEELIRRYGADNWYEWNCKNWGTKWDVADGSFTLDEDGLSGTGYFETAYDAPISAYQKLTKMGFDIDATYVEESMDFAGRFLSETGYAHYKYYKFNFTDENWREGITDSEVLELLESEYESWQQWQEETAEND